MMVKQRDTGTYLPKVEPQVVIVKLAENSVQMSILFVITSLDYGGAETQLKNLALLLHQRGVQIEIVTMVEPAAYVRELMDAGIPVVCLHMTKGQADVRAIRRLGHLVEEFHPDIVHSHMIHANLLCRVSRAFCWRPVPLVCTAHSTDEGGRVRMIAYRLTDPWATVTTQVSMEGLKRYVAIGAAPRNRIVYLPNGVDIHRFTPDSRRRDDIRSELGVQPGQPLLLSVARFEPAKNHLGLLAAMESVHKEHVSAVLALAGKGSLEEEIRDYVNQHGLTSSVRFLGVRQDIPDLMCAADCLVLPSLWEGFPTVLLEAGACELPMIATNVGSNGAVVLDGRTGFLVRPGDSPALVAAINRFLSLPPPEREAMGIAARDLVVSNYSLESIADRWMQLYSGVLGGNSINTSGVS